VRICAAHWEKVVSELASRGLARFAASADLGEAFRRRAAGEFEPLLLVMGYVYHGCTAIYDAMGGGAGLGVCPVCDLRRRHSEICSEDDCPGDPERVVEWSVDQVFADAVERGLVSSPGKLAS